MKATLSHWQQIVKNPKDFILQASTINEWDGWQPFPIGMSFRWTDFEDKWVSSQIGTHTNLILVCVAERSDSIRRPIHRASIVKSLQIKGFRNIRLNHDDYIMRLRDYKFVVSPEGNGVDCHRKYEALMAGCIPIIEDRPETRKKYAGCPILYTTDYKEINTLYLLKQYEKMLNTEYDFSRLFYSSYSEKEKESIRESCNYWMNKTRPGYPLFYK